MTHAIDFYFDLSSPYGYFASTRIDQLAEKYGRTVNWHPVLLGIVFKATGGRPLPMIPIKGQYALRDFERTARFHGIPFRLPNNFPVPTQTAARAMLWVRQTAGDARAVAFAKALYHAYFAEGVDISAPDNVGAVAAGVGFDAAAVLEGANSGPIRERLQGDVEAAMARGVFGAPYVIVDDEPFWGFDRFDQLEAYLKNGAI